MCTLACLSGRQRICGTACAGTHDIQKIRWCVRGHGGSEGWRGDSNMEKRVKVLARLVQGVWMDGWMQSFRK